MSVLSVRIRQRREELGMSQEELAARMGYRSKSSITKIEKGVNDILRTRSRTLPPRSTRQPPGCWAWRRNGWRLLRALSRCPPWPGCP